MTAAQSLLRKATEKRKQVLDPVMIFCVQILNTQAEQRDPRQKDGVLHMIGTLSDILLKVGLIWFTNLHFGVQYVSYYHLEMKNIGLYLT